MLSAVDLLRLRLRPLRSPLTPTLSYGGRGWLRHSFRACSLRFPLCPALSPGGRGCLRFDFLRFRRRRGAVPRFNHGDLRARLHRLAFFGQDLAQDAGHRGGHLRVDLVGVDFEHRLELHHLVARLDQPLRDGAFVHRFTELRHHDARGFAGHQNAARSFKTLAILSGVGMKNSSIGTAYGMDGTSSPPKRLTGASSQRHASSAIRAATSDPTETLKLSSYSTRHLPVLRADARIASLSSG